MIDFSFSNILHSNLINFILMITLFVLLIWLLKVSDKLENAKNKVKGDIESSDKNKQVSIQKVKEAEGQLAHSNEDVAEIIKNAEKIAQDFLAKAENEAKLVVLDIEENAKNSLEREILKIKSNLSKEASKKSLKRAKENIQKTLESNPSLHENFINEAIEKLEDIKF